MDHAEFWRLIDEARGKRDQVKALIAALSTLPPAAILGWQAWFSAYYHAIRREDLWAAIYAIDGGCSDDGFDYARAWLIGQGEATLLAAIRDPESLAAFPDNQMSHELLLGVASNAYRRATGEELPDDDRDVAIPDLASWPPDRLLPRVKWTDAIYQEHFPALYARFIEPGSRTRARGTIDHARFWALVDEARGNPVAVLKSPAEAIGFARWLQTYNQALIRDDLRAACRTALGNSDVYFVSGFRGALIARGHAAVIAAVRDPDAIALPIVPLPRFIFAGDDACSALGVARPDHDDHAEIPDRASWPADAPVAYTPEVLRARFPRLAAGKSDRALTGPCDPAALTDLEREAEAKQRYDQAGKLEDPRAAIALLTEALDYLPPRAPAGVMVTVLRQLVATVRGRRGRMHARLGDRDAALADFDAALAIVPDAKPLRLAREELLGTRVVAAGTPRRVRHPKLGDGTVVSVQGIGPDAKLVIDFADGRKTLIAKFVTVLE